MANFWGFDPINIDGLVFASYNSHDWKRVKNIALELRKLGVPASKNAWCSNYPGVP